MCPDWIEDIERTLTGERPHTGAVLHARPQLGALMSVGRKGIALAVKAAIPMQDGLMSAAVHTAKRELEKSKMSIKMHAVNDVEGPSYRRRSIARDPI